MRGRIYSARSRKGWRPQSGRNKKVIKTNYESGDVKIMKKILSFILAYVLILALAGCGAKEPAADKANSGTTLEPKQSQTTDGPQKPNETASGSKTLPESFPRETLPIAADAEILDVRENHANNGLEVSYVSDNDIDTLCDFYEGALKDAKDLSTTQTQDGYIITAKIDGVGYDIMLNKDAMNPNPHYAGKVSVYLILSGLEGVSVPAEKPKGESLAWPFDEMPGVPELKGHISKILREDGIIHFEMTVESAETIKSYVGELTVAGFTFDSAPDLASDHIEFLAFKDGSIINLGYGSDDNFVAFDYQK
jgi:predicted small lipoprotein YifL